jgi:hypothetical protein
MLSRNAVATIPFLNKQQRDITNTVRVPTKVSAEKINVYRQRYGILANKPV